MIVTVLIFAKYPEPGRVNTRLVPPLSHHQAARLHRAALAATCELARTIADARIVLVVSPDAATALLARELHPLIDEHWAQGPGSLGDRLSRAADRAFENGAGPVLLLGADSPTLPGNYVEQAVAALQQNDAVMGPSDDGGYCLLGLTAAKPELFDGIDWGTHHVAAQTRRRAEEAGFALHELATWHDIDRPEDIRRAAAALQGLGDGEPMRRALQQELRDLLEYLEESEPNHG